MIDALLELLKSLGFYGIGLVVTCWLIIAAIRHLHHRANPRLAFDRLYDLPTQQVRALDAVWYGRGPHDVVNVFRLWELGLVTLPLPWGSRGISLGSSHFTVEDFLSLSRVDDHTLQYRLREAKQIADRLARARGVAMLSARGAFSSEDAAELRLQEWMCGRSGPLQREVRRRESRREDAQRRGVNIAESGHCAA